MFQLKLIAALFIGGLAAGSATGQTVDGPGTEVTRVAAAAKPRTFALIAAVGDQFTIVFEQDMGGSLRTGYKRTTVTAPDNLLNVLALQGLDKVVQQLHPGSRRTYMTLDIAPTANVRPAFREAKMISDVQARLGAMPVEQRQDWDLILVATSSWVRNDLDGLADKLEGFGVFIQPLVGGSFSFPTGPNSGSKSPDSLKNDLIEYNFANQHKEDAITPNNKAVRSKTYVAPYSYIKVWMLDPKTLAVIDEQKRFQNRKLADPLSDSLDIAHSVSKEFMAQQMVALIDDTIRSAVVQSKKNGTRAAVEIGDIREKKQEETRK